jgi:biopolymer transport protein ExbD
LANWDVFHSDRLELERSLSTIALRDALARGELLDDDLIRPAGTTVAWARLADVPELWEPIPDSPSSSTPLEPASVQSKPSPAIKKGDGPSDFEVEADDAAASPSLPPAPTQKAPDWLELRSETDDVAFPVLNDSPTDSSAVEHGTAPADPDPPGGWVWAEVDDGDDDDQDAELEEPSEIVADEDASGLEILDDESEHALTTPPPRSSELDLDSRSSRVALPVVKSRGWDDTAADVEADEEVDFSLSRSGPATVEELDLAPMVDVAFQLVLFFMVTATTVLYKTLEIPKPSNEQAPSAAAQGRSRTLDELQEDYILVEIDSSGAVKIDREPVAADMNTLVERLRTSREKTHRKAMLLSAEYATKHRNCVLAYDAALEIGLGIVIASPQGPQGPAPSLLPAQPARPSAPAASPASPPI